MKIIILGAGAMGSLFGGYLSKNNEVWLVDVDENRVQRINEAGVRIRENDGTEHQYFPHAVTRTDALGKADLLIVFVKAMYSGAALQTNQSLIGSDTYLMTLQNGSGHETQLLKYADENHVVIGTTQHNSSILPNGGIQHGGSGKTSIGLIAGESRRVQHIADTFTACGFETDTSDEVQKKIWEKLFLNTSVSSLTALLQVPMGYILENPHAFALMKKMAHEAVTVANANCRLASFSEEAVVEEICHVLENAKNGYTSIYADLRDGRRTEVDTISGSVIAAAKNCGIPVPCHEMVVQLIHAMEDKARQ